MKSEKNLLLVWRAVRLILEKKSLLLLLDYDGTLAPIVNLPCRAAMLPGMKSVVRKLSGNPGCRVAIISGRSLRDLKQRVGLSSVIYAGCHGMELEGQGIKWKHRVPGKWPLLLKEIRRKLMRRFSAIRGILVENKRLTLAVHYRMVSGKNIPRACRILGSLLERYVVLDDLRLIPGKKVIEIIPPVDWNKGKCVTWLLDRLHDGRKTRDLIPVYIGDDVTDEDAFISLRGKGVTILVGKRRETAAHYCLKNPEEVLDLLKRIVSTVTNK